MSQNGEAFELGMYGAALAMLIGVSFSGFLQPPGSFDSQGFARTTSPQLICFLLYVFISFSSSVWGLALCIHAVGFPPQELMPSSLLRPRLLIRSLVYFSLLWCALGFVSAGLAIVPAPEQYRLAITAAMLCVGLTISLYIAFKNMELYSLHLDNMSKRELMQVIDHSSTAQLDGAVNATEIILGSNAAIQIIS